MMCRSLFVVPILLIGMLARHALADSEYWVSVGSYRTYDEAESARQLAGARLPESFSIAEAQLDSGLWYRVLAGPYLTREIADHTMNEASRQGFTSPWVLVRDAVLAGPIDDYTGNVLATEPAAADEVDLANFKLGLPEEPPMDIPGFNAPVRAESDKEHKLVAEPPAGYFLNRLRRN